MKILYHHRTQGKGVEGIHIRSMVHALRGLKHDVYIASAPGCDPCENEYAAYNTANTRKKSLFALISKKLPEVFFEILEILYNFYAYFLICKKCKELDIDVIYERYFLFSIGAHFAAKRCGIPIIYEVNDSSYVPRLRKLLFVKIAQKIENYVFNRCYRLFTVSNVFKKILVSNGLPEKSISVMHNAIEPSRFNPSTVENAKIDIDVGKTKIGFLGLFVEWIDLLGFLEIFKKLQEKHKQLHLILVGSGPEEDNIRRSINEMGLQDHVTLTGYVYHDKVAQYIKSMDICVIPKHEKYTSPVKLFEYMAMEKAVIAPRYESIAEIIADGENGMMFEPDSSSDLSRVLLKVVEDEKLARSIGEIARKNVLDRHTWARNAKIAEKVMTQAIHSLQ